MAVTKDKILIVDKNINYANQLKLELEKGGYKVLLSFDGKNALDIIASHCPDLVILEIDLPDFDGMLFIRKMRSWSKAPIIILTKITSEVEKARMLDMGADDYLIKPVGMIELSARIRTAFRHTFNVSLNSNDVSMQYFYCGNIKIDYVKHKVFVDELDTHLTPNEFRLIGFLAKHKGETVTYRQVSHELWGPLAYQDNKILRVHISNLRKKIEKDANKPKYLITQSGIGYMLCDK